MSIAVFGAGCFWCVEAIFTQLSGIQEVISGYTGGSTINPTYESVSSGKTGHVEVCKIIYDHNLISYEKLLKVLFQTHNPTTLNQQGADMGSQYRSSIFYTNESQRKIAEKFIEKLEVEEIFDNQIVTEVNQLKKFYKAENYHQDYYKNNSNAPYCKIVIKPKLEKFLKK